MKGTTKLAKRPVTQHQNSVHVLWLHAWPRYERKLGKAVLRSFSITAILACNRLASGYSNDFETTQFSCTHSASLLGQSCQKSSWEALKDSLKQSPAIGSPISLHPWIHLHASFGARSIKAMAAEGFYITPQFTNCATRPWRPEMKYPGGQRPEFEDITPWTDSLRKNSSGFEVGKMQVKRPQGKKLPLRWGVSTFENRVHPKLRRVGFKHRNNSSTNHLNILNFFASIQNHLYIFIYRT